MGKRGRKSAIETQKVEGQVLALHMAGKSQQRIGQELGLSRSAVQAYLAKVKSMSELNTNNDNKFPTNKALLEAQVRLEINQENALSELSKQLQDYTDEYNRAPDDKAKYAWSQNRIRILQEMNKVTGLYEPRACKAEVTEDDIPMTDEELIERAKSIIERRA